MTDSDWGRKTTEHSAEHAVVCAQIFEHRPGKRVRTITIPVEVAALSDHHQPLRLLYGQQAQHDLVQQAEHGRICADPESKCGYSDKAESRTSPKRAHAIANVLSQPLQQHSSADVTNSLPDLLRPSHFPACTAVRFLGGHPCIYLFRRHQLLVGTEFLVQITIKLIPAEQVVPQSAKSTDHRDLLSWFPGQL